MVIVADNTTMLDAIPIYGYLLFIICCTICKTGFFFSENPTILCSNCGSVLLYIGDVFPPLPLWQLLFWCAENAGHTDARVGAARLQPGFERLAVGPPQRAEEQAAEEKCVAARLCEHGADEGDREYLRDQTRDRLGLWWVGFNAFYN